MEESTMSNDEDYSERWGELPPLDEVPEDFADMLIQNAMKPIAMKLHEPREGEIPGPVQLPPECSAMDETVLNTIQLLEYSRSMKRIINILKSKASKSSSVENLTPPTFPEQPDKKPTHQITNPFRYMEYAATPFVEGVGPPIPKISEKNCRAILQKSVATIFAHLGFEDTTQVVLDVMTDVCEEYFVKFTRLLRFSVDHQSLSGNAGFPDIIERVFYEMGIGSVLVLHDFYQSRILKYHQKILNNCRELAKEYAQLAAPVVKQEHAEVVTCKIESDEVEEYGDVPELHFPAGDGCSAEELRPSLEPGFQMLHHIEQEEQLQNLAKEEEITIKSSPKH